MPRKRIRARKVLLGTYVVEKLAYIDSVFVRNTRSVDADDYEKLRQTLPPDERFSNDRLLRCQWEYVNKETGEVLYHHVLIFHQPTKATFSMLQDIQDRQPDFLHLLEVHFALDLTTNCESDAGRLHEAVLSVLAPVRLPATDHQQEYETSYIGRKGGGNKVAVYSDRKGKVRPDAPRVHLEWRIHGATALKRAKVYSLTDLVQFDHRAFWAKRLRLRIMPTLSRLVRVLELRAARKGRPLSPEGKERTKNLISRFSKDRHGRFSAHSLDYLLLRGLHPKPAQIYTSIPNDWALPEPGNALWDED